MDVPDCPYLVITDYPLLSANANWLCMELGDNRKSRPVYGGGLSPRRSTTPNLDVSECPGIRHRLALGEIGGSDYPCFPISSDLVASNSKTDHSRFLSLSSTLSYVDGDCRSWNIILGVLVEVKKETNSSEMKHSLYVYKKFIMKT